MADAVIRFGPRVVRVVRRGVAGPPGPDTAEAIDAFAGEDGASLVGFAHDSAAPAGTVAAKLKRFVHVDDAPFNAVGDGSTDDRNAIQAAIDMLGLSGGGDVVLSAKTYRINSGLDIKYPRVRIIGVGDTQFHDSGSEGAKTVLLAPFAGTTLRIRTPYASEQGVAVANTFKYSGAGCRGVMFNGVGIGTKAVEVDTVSLVDIDVYATGYVGTFQFEVKCGVTGTDLGESCDVYYSKMVFRGRATDTAAERSSGILKLSGSTNANVCLNRAPNHGITVIGQHWDGAVLDASSADNNDISVQGIRAGGSGRLVLARGRTAAEPVGCEGNNFTFLTGQGSIYAQGTGDAGVIGGVVNRITNRDSSNGTPVPTAGTASRWIDTDSEGTIRGGTFVGLAAADSEAVAEAQSPALGTASLRIANASSDHVVLTDGTSLWGFHIDGATGDLRFARFAGTGSVNIGNGVGVKIGGKAVTEGADDSGGAGFKVLRVPN